LFVVRARAGGVAPGKDFVVGAAGENPLAKGAILDAEKATAGAIKA
jgi:hypothetical protein